MLKQTIKKSQYTENIFINDRGFEDLNPVLFGWERCGAGESFGPAVRDCYLLHYILSGKGKFKNERGEHLLSEGQLFLIRPGEITYYVADEEEPWHYIWIGFMGKLAEAFDGVPDVVTCDCRRRFFEMQNAVNSEIMREELLVGNLYFLMAELLAKDNFTRVSESDMASRAASYIERSYMNHLSVEELAKGMHVSRQYLSRIFKQKYGATVQEYIMSVRMKHAAEFLGRGYSVSDTASMTGYPDVFNFSKMFKKHHGVAPSKLFHRGL